MQPNITQVEWSATNVPSGLSFNAQTGTFSGTPTTSGTYTVPVHVETNYGEDTKDVTIAVRTVAYEIPDGEICILEGYPEDVNNPTENLGRFVEYETPRLTELVYLNNTALAGKTVDGDFYYEGAYDYAEDGTPLEGPITLSNVEEIYSYTSPTQSILVRKSDGTLEIKRPSSISGTLEYQGNCDLLIPPNVDGKASFLSDDRQTLQTIATRTSITSQDLGYKVKKYLGQGKFKYLSEDGYLDNAPANFTNGVIKDAIVNVCTYVVTEDDEVYLGRTEYKNSNWVWEWTYAGTFPVKKMCSAATNETFLLTTDGKLYLTGPAVMTESGQLCFDYYCPSTTTITMDFKDGFTQIFPYDYFYDITTYQQKLVVIKR